MGLVNRCKCFFSDSFIGETQLWNDWPLLKDQDFLGVVVYHFETIFSLLDWEVTCLKDFSLQVLHWGIQWIGLGKKNNRKTPSLMVKTMVSCKFSLKPIHWGKLQNNPSVPPFTWLATSWPERTREAATSAIFGDQRGRVGSMGTSSNYTSTIHWLVVWNMAFIFP